MKASILGPKNATINAASREFLQVVEVHLTFYFLSGFDSRRTHSRFITFLTANSTLRCGIKCWWIFMDIRLGHKAQNGRVHKLFIYHSATFQTISGLSYLLPYRTSSALNLFALRQDLQVVTGVIKIRNNAINRCWKIQQAKWSQSQQFKCFSFTELR